jgi:hypothetical protein
MQILILADYLTLLVSTYFRTRPYYNATTGLTDSVVQYERDSSAIPIWRPFWREVFSYDHIGRVLTDSIFREDYDSADVWLLDYAADYLYYNNRLDYEMSYTYKDYSYWPAALVPAKQQVLFNADGEFENATWIIFDSTVNSWVIESTFEYTYTPFGKLASECYKYQYDGVWYGSKTTYTYDMTDELMLSQYSNWDDSTSSWITDDYRTHHQFDRINGRYIARTEYPDSLTNDWHRDSAKFEIAYDMRLAFDDLRLPYEDWEDGFDLSEHFPGDWPENLHMGIPLTEKSYEYDPMTQQYSAYDDSLVYFYSAAIGVGLDESAMQHTTPLRVFPNPAQDSIQIDLSDFNEAVVLDIFDLNGRRMQRHRLEAEKSTVSIQSLPRGTYVLKFQGRDQWMQAKLVKR